MTIDTSEPKITRFCRLKKQATKGYINIVVFGFEALVIWGMYLLTLLATSVPLAECNEPSALGLCPVDAASVSIIVSAVILACFLLEFIAPLGYTRTGKLYLYLAPLGIASAIDLVYLGGQGLISAMYSGLQVFIEFESTLSIPAIIVGVILAATIGYGAVYIVCEIEKKRGHSL